MRRLLTAAVLVVLAAGPALAGQDSEERFYDSRGQYKGRATPDAANPRQKSLYDASGRYVGRVMSDDQGNTRLYDQHGRYLGRGTLGGQRPDPKK